MTREEKQKAIEALKISAPIKALTQEEFNDYIQTLNKIMDWLEQEPTTKNDLGVDCISKEQAQTEIEMNASRYTIARERGGMGQVEWSDQLIKVSDAVDIIRNLPSVTPQEPRKGHWIESMPGGAEEWCYKCSECNFWKYKKTINLSKFNFCPNCGAKMVEPQESEDKE